MLTLSTLPVARQLERTVTSRADGEQLAIMDLAVGLERYLPRPLMARRFGIAVST